MATCYAIFVGRAGGPSLSISDIPKVLRGRDDSDAILKWGEDRKVEWHYIATGKPTRNGFVDRLYYRMCNDLLNEHLFDNLRHACNLVAVGCNNFNHHRPHSSLAGLTPKEYASRSNEDQNSISINSINKVS